MGEGEGRLNNTHDKNDFLRNEQTYFHVIIVVNKSPHKERKQEQSPVMVFSRNLFPRGHIIDSSDPPLFIESSTAISMIPPKHHKYLLVLVTITKKMFFFLIGRRGKVAKYHL